MSYRTTFTEPAAVEAWDAWFRWREGGVLHDRTIDDSWLRVISAVVPVEHANAASWPQRWLHGLSRWQWLPDEALLRGAGTGVFPSLSGPLTATLNLTAFVRPKRLGNGDGELDRRAIAETAEAAFRFLDDALLAMPTLAGRGIRIGLMGLADALDAIGIEYDSPAAVACAGDAGAALASGALRGAIDLARERGGTEPGRTRLAFLSHNRVSESLVGDALRWGVRHEVRTAIAPAPRLALLANNVSDALDPRPHKSIATQPDEPGPSCALPSLAAQQNVRTAMQPWIDEPIDYPITDPIGSRNRLHSRGRPLADASQLLG